MCGERLIYSLKFIYETNKRWLTRSAIGQRRFARLRARLLLLLLEEGKERAAGNLHDLETHTRDITLSVTGTTEASDEHLVVLVDVVEAAIARHESGDLLAVFDELRAHALANGRVGLLGLNATAREERAERGVRSARARRGG